MAALLAISMPGRGDELAKGTLSGTIVDADGKPVAGARVSLNKPAFDDKTLTMLETVSAETKSDSDGRFRLGPLEPEYRVRGDLRVEADGFAPQYVPSDSYSIFSGNDCDLGKIGVYRGRVFSGQVLDVDGKPRAGATVKCEVSRWVLGHTYARINPSKSATTDADGRFHTPPMAVGRLTIYLQEPERELVYRGLQVRPGGEEAVEEPIQLANDVPVVGLVQDEHGRPIDGAAIRANSEYRATSNSQGRFALRGFGLNPNFQMHLTKEGYVSINWSVQITEQGFHCREVGSDGKDLGTSKEFVVPLQRLAWIEGRVVDAETGQPVHLDKAVLCTFERKLNGEILRAGCKNSNFEQPETGHFRVPYSDAGEYTLTFSAAGYHDAETFTPLVKELQPIEGIIVKLKKDKDGTQPEIQKQRMSGTVARDGEAVKTGWVGLWSLQRPKNIVNAPIMRGRTAVGDAFAYAGAPIRNGAYALDVPFQGGGWYVVVEEPGQALTQVGPLTIQANEEKKLNIACTNGGGMSGRVDNVPPEWKGQLWVVAFTKTAIRVETRIDADGKFSFKRLPPGQYGLKVGHDAYEDSEVPRPKDGEDLPKDAFTRIADPWKRATLVQVEAGRDSDGVSLELPQ